MATHYNFKDEDSKKYLHDLINRITLMIKDYNEYKDYFTLQEKYESLKKEIKDIKKKTTLVNTTGGSFFNAYFKWTLSDICRETLIAKDNDTEDNILSSLQNTLERIKQDPL